VIATSGSTAWREGKTVSVRVIKDLRCSEIGSNKGVSVEPFVDKIYSFKLYVRNEGSFIACCKVSFPRRSVPEWIWNLFGALLLKNLKSCVLSNQSHWDACHLNSCYKYSVSGTEDI
jgi:hypothetical protein